MGKVAESIYSGATHVIPMADVSHVIKLSSGIQIVTKHTTYNFDNDEFNNTAFIPMDEQEEFLSAWCRYRSELESETLMNLRPDAPHSPIQDALTKEEADFVRGVFASPGTKLSWDEATMHVDDGSEYGQTICLWKKPEAMGLIEAVGSYKWMPVPGWVNPSLSSQPPQAATPKPCTWTEDADGYYSTGCGECFAFNEGTPAQNKAYFCHHCGGKIEVKQ